MNKYFTDNPTLVATNGTGTGPRTSNYLSGVYGKTSMLSQPELGSGLGKDVLTGSAFLAEMAKELDNMDTQFR